MAVSETKKQMDNQFAERAVVTAVLILALLGLHRLPAYFPHAYRLTQTVHDMSSNKMSREDVEELIAGYYEGILRTGGDDQGIPAAEGEDDIVYRNNFLRLELKPNFNRPYKGGIRFTNSFGLANPEYPYEKPPHTRRIALFGDSQSLGPYGHDYIALLEERLNQNCLTPDIQKYQALNFSVPSYGILQDMDVGLNKASYFHPDVYLVAMTSNEAFRRDRSSEHLASLLTSGTDLKYDYLRQVVAEAGIQPGDSFPAIRRKLAPFMPQVIRWALVQLRDHAEAQGAKMVIIMVPAPYDPSLTSDDFDQLHKYADPVGVPIIDMRDTFHSVDLDDIKIASNDIHPNVRGHAMIADNLFTKLQAQPDALQALAGHPCQLALASSASGK